MGKSVPPVSEGTIVSISGQWTLHYSWGCSGSYGNSLITFNNDGTFSNPPYTGRWSQTNDNLILRFDQAPNTVYAGVLNGGAMVGNQTNWTISGCFYATAGAGSAFAEAQAGEQLDPAGIET
jgi:hypothetical protein